MWVSTFVGISLGFSFSGPNLFDEEVLARAIAASRKDSHLEAQLPIAKAFSLPVFRGARNPDRKASSGQESAATSSSASALSGRGRSYSDSQGGKRKASSSPGKSRSSKSPRRGTSPSSKQRVFHKFYQELLKEKSNPRLKGNRSFFPAQQ